MRVGIVGLPNVGKSTLFNALTRQRVPAANFPFTTVEPNVGIVPIPDERLAAVAKVAGSRKVTPATIEVVDIAGLVKGAHQGEGLGNEFLAHVRPMDALIHVVRIFDDPDVARAGSLSPAEDVTVIRAELEAKDAELAARREAKKQEVQERTETKLAAKPVLYVLNTGEDLRTPPSAAPLRPAVVLSGKLEAELSELYGDDQRTFLQAYGLEHPRVEDIIHALITLLDLVTFFTANRNEARAWLLPRGATAWEAAGKVHADFQRGFIRAETIAWDALVEAGSYVAARKRGLLRDEGKDYAVQDGDVLLFKVDT
ncbi:MAG: GTP-binding protein YchF [Parcubacteria group bacterium Gr01-1014_38]|nr:MAG: GTP-binding protein YchF [Parcubacteria group bacterium Gr01-1014_38]